MVWGSDMSKVKIIVADDSLTARMFTTRCLEVVGLSDVEIREAGDGEKVMTLLQEDSVDLIVLDINMPIMDGKEVLKKVKADKQLKEIPVLIVSSISNPETDKKLEDDGAYAVIKKPVSPAKFMEPIKALALDGGGVSDGW